MNAMLLLALAYLPGQNPSLVCLKPVVDLGATRGGPVVTQQFEVVNRGQVPLTIVHVQPSCGCLAPRISNKTLRPNESASVEVRIGTISQPEGDNLWTVRLFYRTTGSDMDQIADLQVRAKLTREVAIQPAALRLAGKPGLAHEITLTDRRAKPMEVAAVAVSSNKIAVLDEGRWERAGEAWVRKIHVRLTADCPAGRHEEIVQIVAKDEDYRDVRVPVSVSRTDKLRYAVSPGEARLNCEAGKGGETIVLIRDAEGQAIQIESAEADDLALTCRFSDQPQVTAALRITSAPGAMPQRWSSVRIRVKTPVAQTVVVPVTVFANPAR